MAALIRPRSARTARPRPTTCSENLQCFACSSPLTARFTSPSRSSIWMRLWLMGVAGVVSASMTVWSTICRRLLRLRSSTVDVAPATLAWPDLMAANENDAALMCMRRSLANMAKRWFSSCCSRSSLINWRCFENSVTESAIALSRHRFRVRNSSSLMGTASSRDTSMMAWHRSP